MNGKGKCKILKEIRRKIAVENDISFVTSECKHKGDCLGTCPKCEAEVRYLEEQLCLRQKAGKAIAVAGIAATLMVTATGCDLTDILHPVTGGDPQPASSYENQMDGEIVAPTDIAGGLTLDTEPISPVLMGVPPLPPESAIPTEGELMGDPLPTEE